MATPPNNDPLTPDPALLHLGYEVCELDRLYQSIDTSLLSQPVYPRWTVVNVLAHLVWWHESFASIVAGTVNGTGVSVPRGTLSAVNDQSVEELHGQSARKLRRRLRSAQQILLDHSALDRTTALPYRRGSRHYTFEERIAISIREMNQHRWDVLKSLLSKPGT